MRANQHREMYIKANRRANREVEIEMFGKPLPKHKVHRSKKMYDRKRMKADDRRLPSFYLRANGCFRVVALWMICLFTLPVVGTQSVFEKAGMVDVGLLDSTIRIHLVYATSHNFTGKVVYANLTRAWLLPEVAAKVVEAQRLLREKRPDLRLIIYDATRPLSVQQQFWNIVKGTNQQKYVSNPANGGGLHNYGAAVDVSIVTNEGVVLPMGTDFDHFGPEAATRNEEALVKRGAITREALNNRLLLREVMNRVGMRVHPEEWWHFNAYTREYAKKHLKIIP